MMKLLLCTKILKTLIENSAKNHHFSQQAKAKLDFFHFSEILQLREKNDHQYIQCLAATTTVFPSTATVTSKILASANTPNLNFNNYQFPEHRQAFLNWLLEHIPLMFKYQVTADDVIPA